MQRLLPQQRILRLNSLSTRLFGFVALGMVAFYLLASARALVPGLCATQAMNDARCDSGAVQPSASTAGHCCKVPEPGAPGEDQDDRPVTPEESHCAFCNLLIAHTEPPTFVAMPAPTPPAFGETIPLIAQRDQLVARGAAPNRAPPA